MGGDIFDIKVVKNQIILIDSQLRSAARSNAPKCLLHCRSLSMSMGGSTDQVAQRTSPDATDYYLGAFNPFKDQVCVLTLFTV